MGLHQIDIFCENNLIVMCEFSLSLLIISLCDWSKPAKALLKAFNTTS